MDPRIATAGFGLVLLAMVATGCVPAVSDAAKDLAPASGGSASTGPSAVAYVVYVSNGGGTVSQYTIGSGGILQPFGTPATAGSGAYNIQVDPTHQFVFVPVQSGSLSQFTILPDGSLGANGTISPGTNPTSIAIDPTGTYAFVTDNNCCSAVGTAQFIIQANGTLAPNGQTGAANNPYTVRVDPTGQYVYVADGSVVQQYALSGGTLAPLAGAPTIGAGSSPFFLAIDPTGNYVYVSNSGSGDVYEFQITGGPPVGALSLIGSTTPNVGSSPYGVTVDPLSRFVYVANNGGSSVSAYAIQANGSLSFVGTYTAGSQPFYVAVDPTGTYVYVANNGSGDVSQFSINGDGSLNSLGSIPAGSGPTGIAIW